MGDSLKTAGDKIAKVLESLANEYQKIRSGRVSPAVLDGIRVECYGSMSPISQVATIQNPEARMLVVSPWDKAVLSDIEKAIQKENIGVNPSNDGKVIRLNFPPLSEERRKESVKQAKSVSESYKVSVRNIRRDIIDELKKLEKNSEISENERKVSEEKLQKMVDKAVDDITAAFEKKSKEIMEI